MVDEGWSLDECIVPFPFRVWPFHRPGWWGSHRTSARLQPALQNRTHGISLSYPIPGGCREEKGQCRTIQSQVLEETVEKCWIELWFLEKKDTVLTENVHPQCRPFSLTSNFVSLSVRSFLNSSKDSTEVGSKESRRPDDPLEILSDGSTEKKPTSWTNTIIRSNKK